MAQKQNNVLTLADWAKGMDPDGKPARVIEMLNQTNEILDDMPFKEGNLPTGHRVTVRTGLPTVAWRLINGGVLPSKSTKAQIEEACAILEAWSEVDVKLAELNGNSAEFRLSEAQAFIEAMNQEMASTLFYGNSAISPEEFTGFSVRYSSLSAGNAQNIIVGGGSGSDNTSVWLVCWGENTVHGIFPKGSQAGLEHKDLGEQTVEVGTGIGGTRMRALQDQFIWTTGLALKDWRYVVRIPNIDLSALAAKTAAADLSELMIRATHRIPNLSMGRCAFYMNRSVMTALDIQRRDDVQTGGQLSYQVVDGKWVPSFRGIPIRKVDALVENEALVA